MKNIIKPYHISAFIIIAGAICLIIYKDAWLLGIIGLLIGYEIIEHGIIEEKNYKNNEKKCCEKNSGDHHKPTIVGNDEQREGENN